MSGERVLSGNPLNDVPTDPWRQVRLGGTAVVGVVAVGVIGYLILGLSPLDALYQTVTTVTTVGFRELVDKPSAQFRVFTIVLVLLGTGTMLYTFTVLLETLVEGRLTDHLGRRRMRRSIAGMSGHVIVCGWGRVGKSIADYVAGAGGDVVIVERDRVRADAADHLVIAGDATDDEVLRTAGIERAATLAAALTTDADNLYVTLSGRSLRPDLHIVARARVDAAVPKLAQAGANRVVNPQQIGGARMAALAMQPNVADFLDVVMHDGSLEFRLNDIEVAPGSSLVGRSLRQAHIRDQTGALVLAIREAHGPFLTNPAPETALGAGQLLIAIGTSAQLDALSDMAGDGARAS